LALALETTDDGVATKRFFAKSKLSQAWVAHHQIACDQRHLHYGLPIFVLLSAGALDFWLVVITAFLAVRFRPGKRLFIFHWIVNSLFQAAGNLGHVNTFYTHAQMLLEEGMVDDRAGDAHRGAAQRQVGLTAHDRCGQAGAGEAQQLLLHICGDFRVPCILHIAPVDAESGQALLVVVGQNRSQVDCAWAFSAVEAPDGLGCQRVHIHGLRAVAPA